jgi:hypothetical protein
MRDGSSNAIDNTDVEEIERLRYSLKKNGMQTPLTAPEP